MRLRIYGFLDENKRYSPQLSREIVSKLYFRAKAERIPMTVLANRIIQTALGPEQPVERRVRQS